MHVPSFLPVIFLQFVSLGQFARMYLKLWEHLCLMDIGPWAFTSIPWIKSTGIWQSFIKCLFQKYCFLIWGFPKISFLALEALL